MNSIPRFRTDRVDDVWEREIEPDLQKYTVQVAREALREEQARGFDRNPRTIVDRKYDAPIELVKLGGKIEFVSRADVGEIVEWIWLQLIARSPVLTGRYQDSHVVMINGVQVPDIRGYKPGDRVQIVNSTPYARRIEGEEKSWRSTGRKGWSPLAPNGVYRMVFRAAKRRFGANAFLDFKYVKLDLGVKVMGYQGGAHYTASGQGGDIRRRKRILRDQVYPAIQVYQAGQLGHNGGPPLSEAA